MFKKELWNILNVLELEKCFQAPFRKFSIINSEIISKDFFKTFFVKSGLIDINP